MLKDEIPVFIQPKKPEVKPSRQPGEMEKVQEMLKQGKKVKEIGRELNRNPSTIYRWLWGGRKAKNKLRN